MNWTNYKLRVTLRGPFLIPGTHVTGFAEDVSQMRNAKGDAIIPGDLVKGLMRHATLHLEQVTGQTDLCGKWFGQGAKAELGELRGRVIVGDLVAITEPATGESITPHYTRVSISSETGAAKPGHLQTLEHAYPPGQEVVFLGTLAMLTEREDDIEWIEKALRLIPAMGANKSSGYGEVIRTELVVQDEDPNTNHGSALGDISSDSVTLRIRFDRPIMVDSERIAGNIFRSHSIIPGSVLKGALASALSETGQLNQLPSELEKVRFGFAYPGQVDDENKVVYQRPPLPMSLMVHPKEAGVICDAIDPDRYDSRPFLLNNEIPTPLHKSKKRNHKKSLAKLSIVSPKTPTEVRTRTAISATSNSADSGSLFSYQMIRHEGLHWLVDIERNGADPLAFQTIIQTLLRGLPRVGKTEASATIDLYDHHDERIHHKNPPEFIEDRIVVQLLTPAIMIDPDFEDVSQAGIIGEYQGYWENALGKGNVTLHHVFSEQRLVGSFQAYQYRFRKGDDHYFPYVLTAAGSVFVLQCDTSVREKLAAFGDTNLPLPDWVKTGMNNGRILCPFVGENGFGKILFNPARSLPLGDRKEVHYV